MINAGEDGQSNISALVSFGTSVGIYYTDAHAVGLRHGPVPRPQRRRSRRHVWQAPETASASSINNQASVKADAAGNVYVAYKTNAGVGTSAQISLLKRTTGGTWTGRGVSDVDSTNTRAQVAIDTTFNARRRHRLRDHEPDR